MWGNKEVQTFLLGISQKMNLIVALEFELAYCHVTIQHVSHDATPTQSAMDILNIRYKTSAKSFKCNLFLTIPHLLRTWILLRDIYIILIIGIT